MTTETRALEIVEQALAVDAGQNRIALIDSLCDGDRALRASVNQLLAFEGVDFSLMPTESVVRPLSVVDHIPDQIGPYRVTGEIARGGMGAVVQAERSDGLFHQSVAIKLIRSDLASDRARRRFADERRILGRLRHDGIVRIIDGGDVDGRPWLAMDFIDGAPITTALDTRAASRSTRLDAFEAVCAAVIHAHRNLVIHADIKPSNVLMDQQGSVHLLDFGIARLIVDLDQDENGDPYPLTKGYAAPERAVGMSPTIASDVFSLGVLLMAMLGAATPTLGEARGPGTQMPPDGLHDGDLAAIGARAQADDPAARYPDVTELLADVQRARRHRPVLARGTVGWHYVASKFVRRNRRNLIIGGIIGASLLVTSVVSTVQYRRAEAARALADQRFADVRQLANYMLSDLNQAMANAPGTVAARERLADIARIYLDRLRLARDAPAPLLLDTARGYRQLAELEGVSGVASLGRPIAAARALDEAAALLTTIERREPDNADALEELGWVTAARWSLAADNGGSVALNDRAARYFDRALAVQPGRQGALLGALTVRKSRAYDLIWADHQAAAIPLLRDTLAALERVHFSTAWQERAALLDVNLRARLGDALYFTHDLPGSLDAYTAAEAIIQQHLAIGNPVAWVDKLGDVAFNISGVLGDMPGQAGPALVHAQAGITAMRRVLIFGPNATIEKRLLTLYGQASALLADQGRAVEAQAMSAASIALRRERLTQAPHDPQRSRDLAIGLLAQAQLLDRVHARAAGCAAIREDVALWSAIERAGNLSRHDAASNVPTAQAYRDQRCDGPPTRP